MCLGMVEERQRGGEGEREGEGEGEGERGGGAVCAHMRGEEKTAQGNGDSGWSGMVCVWRT